MAEANSDAPAVRKGHPKGLFLLFVTEMAERFSYYGMRALFVLYLVAAFFDSSMSSQVYGSYTGLVYLTPLLGGYIADRYWGNRRSIIVGGLIMALGQFLMFLSACFVKQSIFTDGGAIDQSVDNSFSLLLMFSGLVALILGNGFFKPNISTMVGDLYEPNDSRKDSAFTIFYMGINVGAFFAPFVCGTLGEGSWDNLSPFKWGFLAACVAMLLSVGAFVMFKNKFLVTPDGLGIGLPPSKSALRKRKDAEEAHEKEAEEALEAHEKLDEAVHSGANSDVLMHEAAGAAEEPDNNVAAELKERSAVNENPWNNVENPACSAHNSPLRLLGCIVGALIMFVLFSPLKAYLGLPYNSDVSSITEYISAAVFALAIALPVFIITDRTLSRVEKLRIAVIYIIAVFVIFFWSAFEQAGSSLTIFADKQVDRNQLGFEFKTTWFQSVNPIVVVAFAPVMAILWEKLNKKGCEPASVVKQAIGLALLSIGYLVIAVATNGVEPGVKISMFWLLALYFIHTIGELSLSPIGLSMVNKLAPAHLASLLMGVWFMSNAASNILAGELATLLPVAGQAPKSFLGFEIATLDQFFLLFAIMAGAASILLFCLAPLIKKMMQGIK